MSKQYLLKAIQMFPTQSALAKACGHPIRQSHISNALRRDKTISPELARRIEIATSGAVTAMQLIFGDAAE